MANTAILAVKIVTDAKGATKGFDDLDKSSDRAAKGGLKAASAAAAAVSAALVVMAVKAVDAASQLQQSTGAAQAVFGEFSEEVIKNSKGAADALGLSASAYQNLAAVIGSQLKNAGTPMTEIAGKTDDLISLGADLAATFGGDVADAVGAVSSLMRGERDPIERYGVSITQAGINAYKAANGLDNLTGAADAQANSQAALALLYEQTAAAQGQFGRESDTLAGQQARLNATWENAQAALGTALLPLMTQLASILTVVAQWAVENEAAFQALVLVFAAATAAVWLLNIAMAANPIGLIIIAVAALIAIIVLLVANWETVAEVAAEVWGAVIGWIQSVGQWFGDIFAAIGQWWDDLISGFRAGFDALFGWINDALGWFGSLIGMQSNASTFQAPAAASAAFVAAPDLGIAAFGGVGLAAFAAGGSAVTNTDPPAAGTVVNVTVNGALDPDAVGRQIQQILTRYGRNTGRLASAGGRQ